MNCKEAFLKFLGIISQSWRRHRWSCDSSCSKVQENSGGGSETEHQMGWRWWLV